MIYWKSVIGQACSLMFRIYKINDFSRWPCANCKTYKINDFRRTKSGAADLTTDSSLLCKITTHDPQSGAVDLTILREIAKHKKIPVFFAILSQLFSKCYGDKNTSSKRCYRYAFFYNRSAPCKF